MAKIWTGHGPAPRVGVLVVAYNAATTLEHTLNRLPASFVEIVDHVMVSDDASTDETYEVGVRFQSTSTLPMTVVRHKENLGYGGNQKVGYRWAIDHGLDVVVMLHGDGQYAPEIIEDLVAPAVSGEADAVFGSRMLKPGGARAGGMPLYKYAGNKILTRFQNAVVGTNLSEWHSGYRAYRVDALTDIDFEKYSSDFDFDTEVILGLHAAGKAIAEVPIPTYYGDEICYVNGLKYAKDVAVDVLKYRAGRIGLSAGSSGIDESAYQLKPSPHSSHSQLLAWSAALQPTRVLDVGCSDGQFGALVKAHGHEVVGVDLVKHAHVGEHLDQFVEADLNDGLPDDVGNGYGAVIAADVLEHVIDPQSLLDDIVSRLGPDGRVLISVPNISHWYPRTRIAIGRFDYDQRGPLDQGHVRFFTRRSLGKLIKKSNLRIVERSTVGAPVEYAMPASGHRLIRRVIGVIGFLDRCAVRIWPTMFGYQFLYQLERV